MSLATLEFEIPRRVVLLKKNTRMPDLSQLGVTGDPNVLDPVRVLDYTTGEFLLANAPPMTMYLDVDSDDVWRRTTVRTWVKIFNDSGGSGGDSEYNAHTEYTLASVSPDETLHFEDGDIFMTEEGEAIVFETYRDSDENAYASAPENQFFLEGMVPLIDETGEAIFMESADTWSGNLLDGYFGRRTLAEWRELWESEGSTQEEFLRLLTAMAGSHHEIVFGAPERHLDLSTPLSFVFIKDGTNSFTITNTSLQPWSDSNSTYIIFENEYIYLLQTPARAYSFQRMLGGGAGWQVTNLSTGGRHAFNPFAG